LAVNNGANGKTSTQDWYGQSASATASGSAAQSTGGSAASSSASQTSTSAVSTQTSGGNAPSGQYSAPHYVIYADKYLSQLPSASDLSNYNRFILAFWMTESGPVDNAQAWESFDASYRQQILDEYHAAGIALMVSAFGSTDSPTTNGADPTATAQKLAAWVKQYGLDGVDIDYEDMSAMNSNQAESWLVTFQKELRNQLPEPFLISHAPVAPWFTSGSNYPGGAYVDVHKQAGDGISFYNIQFYNQVRLH
jgi:chitinase